MRDGVKLFTAVYTPTDISKTYPFLLLRTPYSVGPYGANLYKGELGPSEQFEKDGYIFVYQDVRGRYMSEGQFDNMRPHITNKNSEKDVDESADTYDTIEWLLNHVENHNGKVGLWGISYPGFYSSAGMIDSHPALKAVSPQAPIADWFWDDFHRHGALALSMTFNFFSTFGKKREEPTTISAEGYEFSTPDGYQFFLDLGPLSNINEHHFKQEIEFWNQIVEHPNYDEFWQSRNILPHLNNVKAAVMTVGGWFDTEDLYGPLKTYHSVEEKNPGIANVLVMGPWHHGGWLRGEGKSLGDADFGFKTALYFQEHVILKFFNHFLKEEQGNFDFPEAFVFETGANRWRRFDAWPPATAERKKFYFHDHGVLSLDEIQDINTAFDEYISDPNKPAPYTKEINTRWTINYMAEDQRFAARRPDVLVYQTEVLTDDLTLAGPLQAHLHVSTTGTDSDWIVKLIDVYPGETPDGAIDKNHGAQQMLVRAEPFRGRFRESYEHPRPFIPNEVTLVAYELQDVFHTFKRGHRIMIQIQSTWFPFIDRNPQTYTPNIYKAKDEDFITVMNRVYRSNEWPSWIEVGVLE
jgi:putative CocE/NonD family hydrolase